MASNYTEASIKTLSSLEHIRLRPGMYIGRLGNGAHAEDGIYVLLKETIDNSIDEFMMGQGKKIEVEITERSVKVRDYGRGIPLGKLVPGKLQSMAFTLRSVISTSIFRPWPIMNSSIELSIVSLSST